jgi:REP element-mobilizing transposase RayT
VNRTWLLTNTCYGQWLPGDARGFVGHVRDHRPGDDERDNRVVHNTPGTGYDAGKPLLEAAARSRMHGPPVTLTRDQAAAVLTQFRETATVRKWSLLAASVMFNHFHVVVEVSGDPEPSKILGDFKSWGTRALNQKYGEPPSKTWWTAGGSKRKLPDEAAVRAAVRYVLFKQPNPLAVWAPDLASGDPASGGA